MLEVTVAEGVAVGLILAPKVKPTPPDVVVVSVSCLGVEMESLRVEVEAYLTRRSHW